MKLPRTRPIGRIAEREAPGAVLALCRLRHVDRIDGAVCRSRRLVGELPYAVLHQFFEKEGYQTHETADRETKRGTSDPTYLYYTLGKLEILKLREDYREMKGASFSLQEFHDNFVKQGYPPIKIVRRALLGNDSPVL